jgi:hypothetical protein
MVLVSELQANCEHLLMHLLITGCVAGSILGGRWSDRTLARLKAANGGVSFPEVNVEPLALAQQTADSNSCRCASRARKSPCYGRLCL